jgi:hypothetical protein
VEPHAKKTRKFGPLWLPRNARSLLGSPCTIAFVLRIDWLGKESLTPPPAYLAVTQMSLLIICFSTVPTPLPFGDNSISKMYMNFSLQGAITNTRLVPPHQRKEWATLFMAIAWNIWLARNRRVFDNATIPARTVSKQTALTLSSYGHTDAGLQFAEKPPGAGLMIT